MTDRFNSVIENIKKEILEAEEKEEALQNICRHYDGDMELTDDELDRLTEKYGVSRGEFSFHELPEIEGYIAGLKLALQEIAKVEG